MKLNLSVFRDKKKENFPTKAYTKPSIFYFLIKCNQLYVKLLRKRLNFLFIVLLFKE